MSNTTAIFLAAQRIGKLIDERTFFRYIYVFIAR